MELWASMGDAEIVESLRKEHGDTHPRTKHELFTCLSEGVNEVEVDWEAKPCPTVRRYRAHVPVLQ